MSLMDAAAQKTGQQVQQSGGGVPANQQQQQQQSGGALAGLPVQEADLRSPTQSPSVSLSSPRGSVVLDTMTLIFYGVLLADVLLVYIALQVM